MKITASARPSFLHLVAQRVVQVARADQRQLSHRPRRQHQLERLESERHALLLGETRDEQQHRRALGDAVASADGRAPQAFPALRKLSNSSPVGTTQTGATTPTSRNWAATAWVGAIRASAALA